MSIKLFTPYLGFFLTGIAATNPLNGSGGSIDSVLSIERPFQQQLVEGEADHNQQGEVKLSLFDAVNITLQSQLDIQLLAEELHFREGVLQQSSAPFDPFFENESEYTIFQNVQNSNIPIKTEKTAHNTRVSASAIKKIRQGAVYSLSLLIDQLFSPLNTPAKVNNGVIAFTIIQPLLRGYRYGTDAMVERSNSFGVEAAYYELRQEISQRIFNTIEAYWEAVAAKKIRHINAESVKQFQVLVSNTERLINENELAKADLVQPLARLASRKIDLQIAQQRYYRAIEELKFAMSKVNESPCSFEELITSDDFPDVQFSHLQFSDSLCFLEQNAINFRNDLQALRTRVNEISSLVLGAKNALLPQLDVVASVKKVNFESGKKANQLWSPFEGGSPQTDWTVGINFSIPLYNDGAKGSLRQQMARFCQARILTRQLTQQILSDLHRSESDQFALAAAIVESDNAVKENQLLVANETKKLLAGLSTPFFLIDFENSLTVALIQQVNIYKEYYQNIARLRFLSATLFNSKEQCEVIQQEKLTSLAF